MKNIKFYSTIIIVALFYSCEDSLGVWVDKTARIQFVGDTLQAKSFIFDVPSVETDTIILKVQALGNTSDVDRPFVIKQVQIEGEENAVEGEHYLSLGSDEIKKHMVIKANGVYAEVPIVISREALGDGRFIAKFALEETDIFKFGEMNALIRKVQMSNVYEKPNKWDKSTDQYYFGVYSKVKHEFMHHVLVEKKTPYVPNDEFITAIMDDRSIYFYKDLFRNELKIYNDAHPDEPLMSEDGVKIEFPA